MLTLDADDYDALGWGDAELYFDAVFTQHQEKKANERASYAANKKTLNAYKRQRYRARLEDLEYKREYKAKKSQRAKKWYSERMQDPEFRKKYNARKRATSSPAKTRARFKKWYEKRKNDPEFKLRRQEKNRRARLKKKQERETELCKEKNQKT